MKTRLLFLLLFLGGLVFFGCKKSKPTVHEPDTLVEQGSMQRFIDSLQHIDSFQILSLESTFAGTYIVSGTYYEQVGAGTHYSGVFNDDTVTITKYGSAFLIIGFHPKDSLENLNFGFTSPPLSADTGLYIHNWNPTLYYDLSFDGLPVNPSSEYDRLAFAKNNINSINIYRFNDGAERTAISLSGVKIH